VITIIERVGPAPGTCVRVRERVDPAFNFEWHKHAEYELTLITTSSGRRFVGDHVATYGPGDIVLLGPMLPHTWVSEGVDGASATVVHFGDGLLGEWPEATAVNELLRQSAAGIHCTGPGTARVAERLADLHSASPLQRIVGLVDVLDRLAGSSDIERHLLARLDGAAEFDSLDARLERVLAHISAGFRDGVSQRDCADLVGMTPSALCRLFKRSRHRTFTEYVNELRTNEACRLLATGGVRITSVAFEAGFENLSYFNRVFRRTRGMSPTAYRRSWNLESSRFDVTARRPA
jgi:AraC-like DNA-binding protein